MKSIILILMLLAPLVLQAAAKPKEIALANERLVLETNFGNMVFSLFPQVAPKHVAQVIKLARLGVYDGINIYRVEKGFVAQVSNEFDRATPIDEKQRAAIQKIPAEFSAIKHERGILSMARFDDPNSAEVSFSILLGPAPHLDGQYTVFGRLEKGEDVLAAIEKVPVSATNVPETKITALHAEVLLERDVAQYLKDHAKSIPDLAGARVKSLTDSNGIALGFLVFIAGLAFAFLFLDPKYGRARTSLVHLILLASGFGILTVATPLIQDHFPVVGALLFFGLVAIFKLLGKFDAPE
ncbi:MAG: peptidylprolyl isomerase [Bdellovibrionota bacterium]